MDSNSKPNRSSGQNRLFHKLCRRVAIHIKDNHPERANSKTETIVGEVKMIFAMNFNYVDFHGLRDPKRSSDLSTSEMSEFFEKCQQFALERWGISAFDEDLKEFDHGNTIEHRRKIN